MKTSKRIMAIGLSTLLAASLLGGCYADDDEHEYGEHAPPPWQPRPTAPPLEAVQNSLYQEECGACHMAYPPGLLPPVSWEKIMHNLQQHFGENAELDEASRVRILNYLLDHAAGRVNYRLSNRMVQNMALAPMRITELPYFLREHREIPPRLVRGNPKVRSLSQCDACHPNAKRGIFDEHDVYIPGYGRYEDD